MPPKHINHKAAEGRARKAQQAERKAQEAERALEAERAKDWQVGANVKGQARSDAAAAKADEAARKRQEKADLLAAEEAALGPGGKAKTPGGPKKKKAGNDLSMLEAALIGDAEKKTRAQKRAEQQRKEREAQAQKEKQEREAEENANLDPLMANTQSMLQAGFGGREENVQSLQEGTASGLDGALEALNITQGDVKGQRALYAAYEERMLPVIKEEHPGLRLTQYKEKLFAMWKKSPENPQNQQLPSGGD